MLIVGLMSGTSLDGIDAAVVELHGRRPDTLRWKVLHAETFPYEHGQRETIHGAILDGSAGALCTLHAELGEWFATAARRACADAGVPLPEVAAIGSHGQTVWHSPPADGRRGSTLQLGDPATIAERTGCAVVSDFRSRDVAAGGHGAPLVPWVDRLLFSHRSRHRALQNIGGVGNVSWLPPRGAAAEVVAFDTGPGNALIDAVVEIATGGGRGYDEDGRLAARGRVDESLLEELLRHPYFAAPPPKSTGRESFGRPFVERLLAVTRPEGDQEWMDLVATLSELTCRTIADAYRRWLLPLGLDEVFVSGGGCRNPWLMRRLGELLQPLPVYDLARLGMDPAAKEAVAFAVLAWAHLKEFPATLPGATGAQGPRVLGSFTPGGSGRA